MRYATLNTTNNTRIVIFVRSMLFFEDDCDLWDIYNYNSVNFLSWRLTALSCQRSRSQYALFTTAILYERTWTFGDYVKMLCYIFYMIYLIQMFV